MTTLRYSEWKNRQRGSGTRLLSKLFRRGRRAGTISPEEERDVILNRPVVVVVGETELRVKCPPMRRWYAIMEDVFAKLDEAKDNKEAIVKILSVTSRLESPDAEFIRSIIPYASWIAGILGAVIGREGEWIEDEATPAQMFDLLLVCTEILDIEAIVGKAQGVRTIIDALRSETPSPSSGPTSDATRNGSSTTSHGNSSDSGSGRPDLSGDQKPEQKPWRRDTPSDPSGAGGVPT